MSPTVGYDLEALLEQHGCQRRGFRYDCVRCGGRRTINYTHEVFICHRCGWKGNAVTLAKDLGIYRRLSPAEYQELRQRRQQADHAAVVLYQRIRTRRLELFDQLHALNRLEIQAHDAGPDHPLTWGALALVHGERPRVTAELAILENGLASDLIAFLEENREGREVALNGVTERGGMFDSRGRFVEA
jgi:hypothetical protein